MLPLLSTAMYDLWNALVSIVVISRGSGRSRAAVGSGIHQIWASGWIPSCNIWFVGSFYPFLVLCSHRSLYEGIGQGLLKPAN